MKYFAYRDLNENVQALYKADFDGKILLSEFVWSASRQKWADTQAISEWFFVGNDYIWELTEKEATDLLPPAAFNTVQDDRDEIKTFIKFLTKSPKRPFEFAHIPEIYGDILNKFVKTGDLDSARKYAERYLE